MNGPVRSDAPVCWLVIPVKAPGEGKTRLAGVLGPVARAALVRAMLDRVVEAAQGCPAVARVCVVGPSDHALGERVTLFADEGGGLNHALSAALTAMSSRARPGTGFGMQASYQTSTRPDESSRHGGTGPGSSPGRRDIEHPDRLIIIAGDLPQIDATDLAMLTDVPPGAIGIAPDRHGTGTNALSLPVAVAAQFRFQFGPGSYARHRAEIQRMGYNAEALLSDGLEKDIDVPADLADAKDCLQQAH